MALDQDANGVYQIGTAQDWADFCDTHNNGAEFAKLNAVLTADVEVSGNYMIGVNGGGHPYEGVFDGQGHTLTINYSDIDEDRVAPFRRINGATIKNLRVNGTITVKNGKKFAAGIVGGIWGSHGDSRILNCISNVTINDDANHDGTHGGIVGYCEEDSYTLIENCAFTGAFNASSVSGCGGIIGWARDVMLIKDCYVSATIDVSGGDIIARNTAKVIDCFYVNKEDMSNDKDATQVDSGEVASGELCFKLNNRQCDFVKWYQTLGTDDFPLPFGSSVVYPYSDQGIQCNGYGNNGSSISFKNNKEGEFEEHNYNNWGFCQNYHGEYKCDYQQPDFLTPVDNYYEISSTEQLNWFAVKVNKGDVFINAKLKFNINYGNGELIGRDVNYGGIFDGQQHTITVDFTSGKDWGNVALFRNITSATIKNLKVDGRISNNSHQIGGLVSTSRRSSIIQNVIVAVDIASTHSGDGTHGGIIAVAYGVPIIENVGFVGSINAPSDYGTCGMIGYAHSGGNILYKNCYVTGTLDVVKTEGYNSRVFGRNGEYCDNCYTTLDMTKLNNDDRFDGDVVTSTQVSNGELAYKLNGNSSENPAWYQTLGTDNYPVPFSSGHKVIYSHNDFYSNIKTITDGYFEITNADDLESFAYTVNSGNTTANGKLTDDIDMDGYNNFPGIGTNTNRFRGIFDGQKHIISHLYMNKSDENGVGFFRYVTSGGTVIKRFTIDNTCSFSGNAGVGAFVGQAQGQNGDRDLTFEELGNEANVTANGSNGGGILGVDMNSDAIITMKNCYNSGAISSNKEGGALSGWLGDGSKVINCYNMGTISNGSGLYRSTETQNENTFSTTESQENHGDNCREATTIYTGNEADKFSNGTVFASLFAYNANGVDGSVWRMDYTAATPHPVLYGDAIAMREDCQNRMVEETYDVKLYRTVKAGAWNTFCAPFAVPTSQFEKVVVLDTNNQDTDVLHFVTVSGNNTEAGKAYLVKTDSEITSMTLDNVTVSPTITPSTAGGYDFTGVYSPTSLPQDAYVFTTRKLDNADVIIKVNEGTNMNGFRAYLQATGSNARATSFVIDDEITGIITPEGEFIEDGPVYNLGGQRVNKPQRGLYIQNGKKVIR